MNLKKQLNLKYPVVQAPMAGVQDAKLAIGISNAGGLGSLACALLTPEQLQLELRLMKAQIEGAYNVNFFCHQQPNWDEQEQQLWFNILLPYYKEFDIDVAEIKPQIGRMPFTYETAEVLEEFKPTVVSFHFGLPEHRLVHKVKSLGCQIWSTATTLSEALWLQNRGVDAIIAQGLEAGGHRGMFLSDELSTQVPLQNLLNQLLGKIQVPILAAGGIADPQQLQKILKSGVELAQVGTLFLLCTEATTSALHRSALCANHQRTEITNLFTGRLARGLVNRFMQELNHIPNKVPKFPLATSAIMPLRMQAEKLGKSDFTPLWAGTQFNKCQALPCAQILSNLAGSFN